MRIISLLKNAGVSLLLLFAHNGATAQILNGDFNHLLEYRRADINLPFGSRGQTINFNADKDVNNAPTYVQPSNAVCANFTSVNFVVPTTILRTTFTSNDNYKLDLSVRRFRKNSNSSNVCTYATSATSDAIIAEDAFLIDDPRNYPKDFRNFSSFQFTKDNGTTFTNYRGYWRYNAGSYDFDPLQFGSINPGETKTHTNYNYSATDINSIYGQYGYFNRNSRVDFYPQTYNFQNSPDVTYSFTIPSPGGFVTIDTDNPTTDFDSYLTLLKREFNGGLVPFGLVNTDETGGVVNHRKITAQLCAGDYLIVVEGKDGSAKTSGKFLLSVNLQGNSAGSIEAGHAIPNPQELISDFVTSLFTPSTLVMYNWESREDGANNWVNIPQSDTVAYRLPPTSTSTYFRRRATFSCAPSGNVSMVTDLAFIRVVNPNGVLSGKVTSLNGVTGIKGIEVIAYKNGINLPGSPASFTYRDTTDNEGEYSIQPVYYGRTDVTSSTAFVVKPIKPGHRFNKDSLIKTLTTLSTQQGGINFIDSTGYAITGKTYQQCTTCTDAVGNTVTQTCPLDSVRIATNVSGVLPVFSGYTLGQYGVYGMVVENPGVYNISASFRNHLFAPPIRSVSITNTDIPNIDFNDTSTRVISGKLTAGCGEFIGRADLEFTDILPADSAGNPRSSCFRKRITTSAGSGSFSIRLPARKYKVSVVSFSQSADVTELLLKDFFNKIPADSLVRDITERDTTINLVYQRPPVLVIEGLPNVCNRIDSPFALIPQANRRMVVIKVFNGPQKTCPVKDSSLVLVKTNIQTKGAEQEFSLRTKNGSDTLRLVAGEPNIVYPHYKTFNVVYNDPFGRADANLSVVKPVVVTGVKSSEGQGFVSVTPELPFMVLHDPPGDKSYSYWEQNKTNETAIRMFSNTANANKAWVDVKMGAAFSLGGLGIATDFAVWGKIGASMEVTGRNSSATELIVKTTTKSRFSTTASSDIVGGRSDVFIGAAINLKYGLSTEVKFTTPCTLEAKQALIVAQNGFATNYIYTEDYIRNDLIPTLKKARSQSGNTDTANLRYDNGITVWEQALANNDYNKRTAQFALNRSFNGGGTPYDESVSSSTTRRNTLQWTQTIDKNVAIELGIEVAGSGASGGGNIALKMETGTDTETITDTTTTIGYHLEDKDPGDVFSVDIKKDRIFNTPVFDLVAGKTSCPFEPGTLMRDQMQLTVPQSTISGVAPDGEAEFIFQLANTSESDEARTYRLSLVQSSNRFAAQVSIGGNAPGIFPSYRIGKNGQIQVVVKVKRGLSSVYSYEGLQFVLSDSCDGTQVRTASINVNFISTCSNIILNEPADNWTLTKLNNNILPIIFKGYTIANLTDVTVQISPAGLSDWVDVTTINKANIANYPSGTQVNLNLTNIEDGLYNIRLKLTCPSGIVFSNRATGLIDRSGPVLLGKQQPTDDVYINGDIIGTKYSEKLDCASITNFNAKMKRLSNGQLVDVRLGCYENEIVIVPVTSIASWTDDSIEVTLNNIPDIYSNTKPTADIWRFTVGASIPDNSNRALKLTVGNGLSNVTGRGTTPVLLESDNTSIPEDAGDSITFIFKMPVPVTNDMRINYIVSGNGSLNSDYTVGYGAGLNPISTTTFDGSKGSVFIRKGNKTATVKIKPIPNNQAGPNKTITLSLAEGGDYLLGDSTIATATIINNDLPTKFTFTGNGNFTEQANWLDGLVPAYNSIIADEIIIDPAGNGECILNVPLRMRTGGKFTLVTGKKLKINGNLRVANF